MSVRPCPTCYTASPLWLEACSQEALVDFYRCAPCETLWRIPKLHPTAAPSIIRLERDHRITLAVECWSCGQPVILTIGDGSSASATSDPFRAGGDTDRDRKRWPCPWCEFRNLGGAASRVIAVTRAAAVVR